jgi:hypothetical protein
LLLLSTVRDPGLYEEGIDIDRMSLGLDAVTVCSTHTILLLCIFYTIHCARSILLHIVFFAYKNRETMVVVAEPKHDDEFGVFARVDGL